MHLPMKECTSAMLFCYVCSMCQRESNEETTIIDGARRRASKRGGRAFPAPLSSLSLLSSHLSSFIIWQQWQPKQYTSSYSSFQSSPDSYSAHYRGSIHCCIGCSILKSSLSWTAPINNISAMGLHFRGTIQR